MTGRVWGIIILVGIKRVSFRDRRFITINVAIAINAAIDIERRPESVMGGKTGGATARGTLGASVNIHRYSRVVHGDVD